ncbi:MAG: tRNA (adenosine(37)-N6)-threonylcarbamoyltransferase complex dimerization subunit type 1 TsaB [Chlamydiae bacterium RIFCSPLOWO2_01_FULL_28_7]|nr:MAG: tRNA (adenosine(37)-N6)-threonylcarbamoyltransferase complex dimerization subunit type 1 TsaB [Chlamydiae bacterium RIFCSPLOWO2_01_FULL_28_7]
MRKLIIDTSHEISYVILADGNKILFFEKIIGNKNLSKILLPTIEEILKQSFSLDKLTYIALSFGPGSYTGIRVAGSIAKIFSLVKKLPLVGYISLQAYSPNIDGKFLSIFDAKSEKFYVLEGEKNQNTINFSQKPKLIFLEDLKKYFENYKTIVSPDSDILLKYLDSEKDKINIFKSEINPNTLISLTDSLFINKKILNSSNFDLLYLNDPTTACK